MASNAATPRDIGRPLSARGGAPASARGSGGASPSPVQNPSLICTSCRRTFFVDTDVWVKVAPPPNHHPNTAIATQTPSASLPQTFPKVVFDVMNREPTAQELQTGTWVRLTREACLSSMFAVGELVHDNFPVCLGCWTSRNTWLRGELDRMSGALQSTIAVRNPNAGEVAVGLTSATSQTLIDSGAVGATASELAELSAATDQLHSLKLVEAALDAELAALTKEEDAVAGRVNDYLAAQFLLAEETDQRTAERKRLAARANALSRTFAMRELFAIDVTGPVGHINGLRVGRIPSTPTPTPEINQACGYLIQAVDIMVKKHSPPAMMCVLQPQGDHSGIEVTKPKRELQDFYITQKFFSWKTFGPAWVSFASVVATLVSHLRKRLDTCQQRAASSAAPSDIATRIRDVSDFKTPSIVGDKVGGQSIRYGDASDATWTAAVKHLLTVVRWCFDVDDALDELEFAERTGAPRPPAPTIVLEHWHVAGPDPSQPRDSPVAAAAAATVDYGEQ